jgi:CBS domain-containing protein
MAKLVREVMTRHPRTVAAEWIVVDAARVLEEEDVGAVPVVSPGLVVDGMLTDRDIAIRVVAAGRDPRTSHVGEVATQNVRCVYADESLDEAVDLMAYARLRRLPVIDEEQRLVGILALADIVHELKDKDAGKLIDEISQPAQPVPTLN